MKPDMGWPILHANKTINKLLLAKDMAIGSKRPHSFPISITMNLSNVCNLSCAICNVNKLRNSKLKRVINQISISEIEAFSHLFKTARSISFMGLVGESILNPHFDLIVKYLKNNFDLKLWISTNGMALNNNIQDIMMDIGFDNISFSLHAASPESYRLLQGGNFDVVIGNLERLQTEKRRRKLSKPFVTVVHALNKINIGEAEQMIDLAVRFGINKIIFYHYRDYGFNEISIDRDYQYANKRIDDIYGYAERKGAIHLLPKNPPYYRASCKSLV